MEGNVPGGAPRKGMSTGCLVALVVGIALLVMIIVGGVLCYTYKDKLAKVGVTAGLQSAQAQMHRDLQPGVDSVMVNRVCDAYLTRLEAEETVDLEGLAYLLQILQRVPEDKLVDSTEAAALVDAMVQMYPELKDLAQPEQAPADSAVTDSVAVEEQ